MHLEAILKFRYFDINLLNVIIFPTIMILKWQFLRRYANKNILYYLSYLTTTFKIQFLSRSTNNICCNITCAVSLHLSMSVCSVLFYAYVHNIVLVYMCYILVIIKKTSCLCIINRLAIYLGCYLMTSC